ncbi:hypothetical protein D7Z54_26550 [Salibacterium salarium]|uniref:Uncharacterized protein n=1 Tax=Salibacterium salarium TaxID=284579 RepID=A0A428MVV6_9BACI|nr:hypothetical protein [Salibacterium salarium]RSL30280.1 hypothetical protein D7Z54_26550 [Salibacterium salarium]
MTRFTLLKWLITAILVSGVAVTVYFFTTPTFSHDYKQLTERVEVGLKYTNPEDQTMYFHPYIENPNSSSDLTWTHSQNFMKIYVLDQHGNILEDSVTIKGTNNDKTEKLETTLSPGEKEQNTGFYKIDFPDNADHLQVTIEGVVEDEFGLDTIEEVIEVDIDYFNI